QYPLGADRPERADQLVLEVGVADGVRLECAPEERLLVDVAEPANLEATRHELSGEPPDAHRSAHRHNLPAVGVEIPPEPRGKGLQRDPVAGTLDKHDDAHPATGWRGIHRTIVGRPGRPTPPHFQACGVHRGRRAGVAAVLEPGSPDGIAWFGVDEWSLSGRVTGPQVVWCEG